MSKPQRKPDPWVGSDEQWQRFINETRCAGCGVVGCTIRRERRSTDGRLLGVEGICPKCDIDCDLEARLCESRRRIRVQRSKARRRRRK